MSAPPHAIAWTDANRRLLMAEFARLREQLRPEREAGDDVVLEVEAAGSEMPAPAAIDYLADRFGLSTFERDVLLLCAGVEMDSQLAALVALATGEANRGGPTFGTALARLDAAHWSALTPNRPLRRWRLVELDDTRGVAFGRLRIDERILHYLAGVNYLDVRLRSLVHPVSRPVTMAATHRLVCEAVGRALEQAPGTDASLVVLTGDDALGQVDVAAEVAAVLGLSVHRVRAEDVPAGHTEMEAFATLWAREAVLLGGALLVSGDTDGLSRTAVRLIESLRCLVFVSAVQPPVFERPALRFSVDKPDAIEQRTLWEEALGEKAALFDGVLDGISSQYTLSARTIYAQGAHLERAVADTAQLEGLMWSTCREMGRSKLDDLAQRIDATAGWDDLILPPAQKTTLRQIGANVRNRLKVHLQWGFAGKGTRGLGVTALFAGESGTGKTMAAEVLANELQLDLYRIDLSSVVSKYIGETEKNLSRVFEAAEQGGAILLFDEADALFGRRSEVKDSHDRYANIEVSYLLQRMDAYGGLAILTSNLKAHLDTAFQRRLRFVVQFPFPDQAMREAIWRTVFPARTPLGPIDYGQLARLNMAGGHIRNIALNAAFLAAEANEPVSMRHLRHAAHHEAGKREQSLSDAETRGWV